MHSYSKLVIIFMKYFNIKFILFFKLKKKKRKIKKNKIKKNKIKKKKKKKKKT